MKLLPRSTGRSLSKVAALKSGDEIGIRSGLPSGDLVLAYRPRQSADGQPVQGK